MARWKPMRCFFGRHEWAAEIDANGESLVACRRCHDLRPAPGRPGEAIPSPQAPGSWGQRV